MIPLDNLELRVLAGDHRHARCAVRDNTLIGASSSCDIVLRDHGLPERAARVFLFTDGWRLHLLESAGVGGEAGRDAEGSIGGPSVGPPLRYGQAAWLGAACITVSTQEAPWTEPDEAEDAGAANGSPPLAGAEQGRPASPARTESAKKRPARTLALLLTAGMIVASLGLLALLFATPSQPTPTADPPSRPPAGMGDYRLGVLAAVEALGLEPGVRVVQNDDHAIWVRGWVRNPTQYRRLAQALMGLEPRPVLHVECAETTERELQDRLDKFDARSQVRYQGNGQFQVRGVAASASVRDAMQAVLDGAGAIGGDRDILLASEVQALFQAEAARADLPAMALAWESNRLRVRAPYLDDARKKRLFDLIATINAQHWQILLPPAMDAAPRTLPFRIRTIVGGEQPWVLLEDGTKLLPGGTHKHYRLVAIEEKRLVFDAGGTIVIAR